MKANHVWIIEARIGNGDWFPSVGSIYYLRKEDALEEVRGRNQARKAQHFNKLKLRVKKYKG